MAQEYELEEFYESGVGRDDVYSSVQLAHKLVKPDEYIAERFKGEVFTDFRKANLDNKEYAKLENLIRRARNVQLLIRPLWRRWIQQHADEIAERLAEEWARKEAELFYKGLAKEATESARESFNGEEPVELKIGVDVESFEELVRYYKQLYLPKARLHVLQKMINEDFYPYYHYKEIAQKLMMSGSKSGWFLKLFRTTYHGKASEEGGKKGLFR